MPNACVKTDTRKPEINVCGPTRAKNATLMPPAPRLLITRPRARAKPDTKETERRAVPTPAITVTKMRFVTLLAMAQNRANASRAGLGMVKRANVTRAMIVTITQCANTKMAANRYNKVTFVIEIKWNNIYSLNLKHVPFITTTNCVKLVYSP